LENHPAVALSYLAPHKRSMIAGLVLMVISAGLALLTPYLIKKTIDDYIATGDLHGLGLMALATFGAYALDFVATWQRRINLEGVGTKCYSLCAASCSATIKSFRPSIMTKTALAR
jgi:ABC-type multidrug transport system fused ATPase/permease subunit